MTTRSPEVDAHIAGAAEPFRGLLSHLRDLILEEGPDLVETIGYGIPTYKLDGHNVVHFTAAARHCSFFPGSEAVAVHAAELAGFSTAKGTIRFSPAQPLPDDLVRTIVRERLADAGRKRPRR